MSKHTTKRPDPEPAQAALNNARATLHATSLTDFAGIRTARAAVVEASRVAAAALEEAKAWDAEQAERTAAAAAAEQRAAAEAAEDARRERAAVVDAALAKARAEVVAKLTELAGQYAAAQRRMAELEAAAAGPVAEFMATRASVIALASERGELSPTTAAIPSTMFGTLVAIATAPPGTPPAELERIVRFRLHGVSGHISDFADWPAEQRIAAALDGTHGRKLAEYAAKKSETVRAIIAEHESERMAPRESAA